MRVLTMRWMGCAALGLLLTSCVDNGAASGGGAGTGATPSGAPAATPPPGAPVVPGMTALPAAPTTPPMNDGTGVPPGEPPMSGVPATGGMADASVPAGDGDMPLVDAGEPSGDGDGPEPSDSPLPVPTDYGATGPFADAKMFTNVGPGGNYTLFRPDASLGQDGFKHPIVAWGNGITTMPPLYRSLLTTVASHGFVVIATNDTTVERPAMDAGLEWLLEQNTAPGDMQGKLDPTREATIGYSWGGGAAIDTANRPNVLATVSFHGMPPRRSDAFATMHAPLLLFTSVGDTFVNRAGYVQPNYDASTVQTALAEHEGYDHLTPLVLPTGDAGDERAPAIAWLYLWVYGEQDARKFFYGDDCLLCGGVWTDFDRKNWP